MEEKKEVSEMRRDPILGPTLQEVIAHLPMLGASRLCRTAFDDESPIAMLGQCRREAKRIGEVLWLLIEDVFDKRDDTGVRSVLQDMWASLDHLDDVQKAALIELQINSGEPIRS